MVTVNFRPALSFRTFPVDIATIIGLFGGFGMLFGAIMIEGSNPMSFLNVLATVWWSAAAPWR